MNSWSYKPIKERKEKTFIKNMVEETIESRGFGRHYG